MRDKKTTKPVRENQEKEKKPFYFSFGGWVLSELYFM